MANGRCRMHGGTRAHGIAHPSYKTGAYSRYLPARLRETYLDAQTDETLLHLRERIALVETRLRDVLSRVDTGESGEVWQALAASRKAYLDAVRATDFDKQREALSQVLDLIGRGHADYAAWRDVMSTLREVSRLIDLERRRMIDAQQMLTQQQAIALLTAMVDSVREHVQDTKILTAVQQTFDRLVGPVVERAIDEYDS